MTSYECRIFYPLLSQKSFELLSSWSKVMTIKTRVPTTTTTSSIATNTDTKEHTEYKYTPLPLPSNASALTSYYTTPYTSRSSSSLIECRTDHYLILTIPSTYQQQHTYHPTYYGMKVRDTTSGKKAKLELKLFIDSEHDITGIEGWWKCITDKIVIDSKNPIPGILKAMLERITKLIPTLTDNNISKSRLIIYQSLLTSILSTTNPTSYVHEIYVEKQRILIPIPQGQVEQTDIKVSSPTSSTTSYYRSIATESDTRTHTQPHIIHTIYHIVKQQEIKQETTETETETSTSKSTSTSTSTSTPHITICGYPAFVCEWNKRYNQQQQQQQQKIEKARL